MSITPILTVEAVIFDARGALLLTKQHYPPFMGQWSLPSGLVRCGETVETAVVRVVGEHTNFSRLWYTGDALKLLRLYSNPGRDPRGSFIAAAFFGMVPVNPQIAMASEYAEWVDDWEKLPLAFDHGQIARDAFAVFNVERGPTGPSATAQDLEDSLTLTPRQRGELKEIYSGKGSKDWRRSYQILQDRGLITQQHLSSGGTFWTITRKGMDVLTHKPTNAFGE